MFRENPMERVDIAIAGAGIAGSLAARDLARAGHSVLVVDRCTRDHLSHDWWDAILGETFRDVDLPDPEPPERMNSSGPLTVSPPLETMSLQAPAMPEKWHIDRKLFAQRLVRCAEEAGARFAFATAARGPLLDGDKVAGLAVRKADGAADEIRAQLVIDATGVAAALRSRLPANDSFQPRIDREDMFVTHREIRANTSGSRDTQLVFGADYGVRWINREQDGLVDFFAGVINRPNRPSPHAAVRAMTDRATDAGPKILRGGYGGPIPVRRSFDAFAAPGFLLCGDAACQCNPIDGSGMESSLRAARFAASAVHAALENGRTDPEALWPYTAAWQRSVGVRFVALDALQKFLTGEKLSSIEILFRRGILKVESFWGTGGAAEESKAEQILKLLKLLDRPAFMLRLVRAVTTAKELAAHYADYPETYDRAAFDAWKQKTQDLFARVRRIR